MLKAITTIGAVQVLAIIATLIKSKLLALLLGPAGVGVMSLIDQFAQLVLFASSFSLPTMVLKFLSRSHSHGPVAFERSHTGLLRLLLVLAGLGAALTLLVASWQPAALGAELAGYQRLLIPALAAIPVMATHGYVSSVLAAAGRGHSSAVFLVLITVTLTVSATTGILIDRAEPLRGMYWASLLASVMTAVGGLLYVRRALQLRLRGTGLGVRAELRANPQILSFSLILYVSSFVVPLAYFIARHGVLSRYGAEEAGLLQAAFAVATSLALIMGPTNNLFLSPLLNRDAPLADKLRATLDFSHWLIGALVLLALPLVLFPEWLLIALYSPAFLPVAAVVPIYVVAVVINQLAAVTQTALIGVDDVAMASGLSVVGYVVFGALAWILVPSLGVLGVAVALAIGSTVAFGLTLSRLILSFGLVPSRRLAGLCGYSIASLLVAGQVATMLDPWNPVAVAGKVLVAAAVTVGLGCFLTAEQRRQLMAILGRWRGELREARPVTVR